MNTFECKLQDHHLKKIITVCLDIDCQNKRLCCYQCIASLHNDHLEKIVQVEQINDFIEQAIASGDKDHPTFSYAQNQLIKGLQKLSEIMEGLQILLKEKLEQIQKQNLQELLQQYSNVQQGADYWNQLIEGLVKYVDVKNFQLIERQQTKLNDLEKRSIEVIKQSEQNIQEIIRSFSFLLHNDLESMIDFSFSNEYKHKDIKIEDKFIAEKIGEDSFSMVYVDHSFDPQCQSIEFDIKILQKACNIWVGVGQAQNTKNANYLVPTFKELGHGQYMLIHNGQPLHSTNDLVNCKTSPFGFGTGDVIRIQYEVDTNILKFTNFQNKLEYSMKITELEEKLYPAVLLYKQGDTVRISNGRIF